VQSWLPSEENQTRPTQATGLAKPYSVQHMFVNQIEIISNNMKPLDAMIRRARAPLASSTASPPVLAARGAAFCTLGPRLVHPKTNLFLKFFVTSNETLNIYENKN